jgi:DNA mismatch repair protein MutS
MHQNLTPAMEQYQKIKSQYPDEILFFRMGDFYEMFGSDAEIASKILGIALTSRAHGKSSKIPLAGVPYHSAEKYLTKLLKAGKKVVICEQVEDPKLAKGVVKREVVEIITPGTITVDQVIERESNNYLVAIAWGKDKLGWSMIDLTTGEFKLDEDLPEKVLEKVRVLEPTEILLSPETKEKIEKYLRTNATYTLIEDWKFQFDFSYKALLEHFQVASLDGFGCESSPLGITAAGVILSYLKQTKKTLLSHINKISLISDAEVMFLDFSTIRNLELLSPMGASKKEHTLYALLNQTKTPLGARLLKKWVVQPLLNLEKIKMRQEAIKELLEKDGKAKGVSQKLNSISDLERLVAKIGYNKAHPKDLIWLKLSCQLIPEIKEILKDFSSPWLKEIWDGFPDLNELVELLEKSIVADPPLVLTEGSIIKPGYSSELDHLKSEIKESKNWIASLAEKEKEKTGISSLKVGFTSVFGYYIEVTRPHLSKVPPDYIRKQTLVNAERFITEELKEKEEKILGAEEKINQLEYEIFLDIRQKVSEKIKEIQKTAELLALLDVGLSLKEVAQTYRYVCPELSPGDEIEIIEGRHPVIENLLPPNSFVPNDTKLNREELIHIITGPNMAGKSTYLRQVSLIVILAQMGSFVPAKSVRIGIVDRIFTRVGTMDNLALGQSTFLVEMNETANILNNATPKSLILLDEVGRGTSTFDGLSLAWAVTEEIHNNPKIQAKTLFATHYHELTELEEFLPKAKNYNIAVKEWQDQMIFLRKIIPGGCDDSYGIQVAKLAGIPKNVLERAKIILQQLETKEAKQPVILEPKKKPKVGEFQLNIFTAKEEILAEELRKMDLNQLTPLEALNKLQDLKKKVE